MPIETRPMDGPFGVEVLGLNLGKPLTDDQARELISIFHNNQVMTVRGQNLAFEQFDALTKHFGDQRPHFLDHLRLRGHPAILMLSNLFEDGKPLGVYEGAAFWHTDVAYEDPPNSSTIVYALEVPDTLCPTEIADCISAYSDLPQAMKDRINDLVVVHHYGNRWDMDENSKTSAERLTEDQKQRVKNVHMPMVRMHPATGAKALYGMAGSSFGIVGWPDDEAMDLIDELARHCIQEKYQNCVNYAVGDVAAWDTFSTLHKAQVQAPATGDNDRRLLWRVSVTGLPPVCRQMAAE
jgi:taurine dioxygenase